MNKVTKLLYVAPPPMPQDEVANGMFVRYVAYNGGGQYPTHEQIEAHVAEMNQQNWKLITMTCVGVDYGLTFLWVKDVMLSELSRDEL